MPPHTLQSTDSRPPVGEPLTEGRAWHFTTPAGLVGIVQSSRLWASSVFLLNDTSELTYGMGVIMEAWEQSTGDEAQPGARELLNRILEIEDPLFDVAPLYILSASKVHNLIHQWMSYSTPSGFAVELNLDADWDATYEDYERWSHTYVYPEGERREHGRWFNVIYKRSRQLEMARELIRWFLAVNDAERYNPPPGEVMTTEDHRVLGWSLRRFQALAAQFKDEAFEAEQEVRFLTEPRAEEKKSYRVTSRGIIPYVNVSVELSPNVFKAAIDGVVIGPSAPAAAEGAVRVLLKDYNVAPSPTVARSPLPPLV